MLERCSLSSEETPVQKKSTCYFFFLSPTTLFHFVLFCFHLSILVFFEQMPKPTWKPVAWMAIFVPDRNGGV